MIFFFLSGCAHSVHQYSSFDSYPSSKAFKSSSTIKAEAEQFVILSFAFNTDYADSAYKMLLAKCPRGEIVGINARYSTSMHFLSYTNKLILNAYCLN